jgi:hypothetical protein
MILNSGLFHFSGMAVGYASSEGVPLASFLAPLAGIMAIVGDYASLLVTRPGWEPG